MFHFYIQTSFYLCNLVLTGRATPQPITGVDGKSEKNDVGFLARYSTDHSNINLKLVSRLRAPSLPIWVTCVDDHWGVLFHTTADLLKSTAAQNRYYCSCISTHILCAG